MKSELFRVFPCSEGDGRYKCVVRGRLNGKYLRKYFAKVTDAETWAEIKNIEAVTHEETLRIKRLRPGHRPPTGLNPRPAPAFSSPWDGCERDYRSNPGQAKAQAPALIFLGLKKFKIFLASWYRYDTILACQEKSANYSQT